MNPFPGLFLTNARINFGIGKLGTDGGICSLIFVSIDVSFVELFVSFSPLSSFEESLGLGVLVLFFFLCLENFRFFFDR